MANVEKDFDQWNRKKKETHTRSDAPFYHEREVWWCSLGMNIGFEQDGAGVEYRRPVLVLKGMSEHTCLIIPLTTSTKHHTLRVPIGRVGDKEAQALLSQMRVIDTKRLVRKIGYADRVVFEHIRKTVKAML